MNNKNNLQIIDIVKYIINNFSDKYEFTHMKLQKLIFYIYVKYLLTYKEPLVQENIEAWSYGPVFPNLYLSLKHYYNNLIKKPFQKGNEKKITEKHKKTIHDILEKYGNWTASQLVNQIHKEKAWKNNFREADWSMNIISDEDVYKYYGNQ